MHDTADRTEDLSTLAWVHDELRRTLESALKSLRRYVRESRSLANAAIDAPDPAVLRQARSLIHQGVGALELVNQNVPAQVLRAGESAVARIGARAEPGDDATLQAVERLCFALLDYLKRLLGGRPVSPLALFPAYEAVQHVAGVARVHPADLWPQWPEAVVLPAEAGVRGRPVDARSRGDIERDVLAVMKGPASAAAQRLSDTFAALAAMPSSAESADASPAAAGDQALWRLASACFEALALGHVQADVHVKRLASGLMSHVRRLERGKAEPADALVRELQFTCALAAGAEDAAAAPRLSAVCAAFGLVPLEPGAHADARLGRFDPAWLPLARKRVGALKDSWSGWAAGETRPFAALAEQSSLVADSLAALFPMGERLGTALQAVMAAQGRTPAAVAAQPEVALEVATVLLYVEASLDEAALDRPELAGHVEQLAARLDRVLAGRSPDPIEPWMEALYREVSDHQTIGSVVQELRSALAEVETHIDRFARKPAEVGALMPVPGQLASMRGVLSVLGLDHAAHALVRMRDDVDHLVSGGTPGPAGVVLSADASGAVFERLAENVGAMGFLIDMLGVQPHLAKSLFRYDAASGRFGAVVGLPRAPLADALVGTLDTPTAETGAGGGLAPAEVSWTRRVPDPLSAAPAEPSVSWAAPASPLAAGEPRPAPMPATDDEDMRAVFIEEAQEVLADAGAALEALMAQGDDLNAFTVMRRAFHTLKGSSRMVGLAAFGDAAWAFEQLYNTRLAEPVVQADGPLCLATAEALAYLKVWVDDLARGHDAGHGAAVLVRAAQGLREKVPASPSPVSEAVEVPIDLPVDQPMTLSTAHAAAQTAVAEPFEDLGLPTLPALADADEALDAPEGIEDAWALDALPVESPEEPLESPAEAPAGFADTALLDVDGFDLETPVAPAAPVPPAVEAVEAAVPASPPDLLGLSIDLSDFDAPPPPGLPSAAGDTPDSAAPVPDGLSFELDLDLPASDLADLFVRDDAVVPPEPGAEPARAVVSAGAARDDALDQSIAPSMGDSDPDQFKMVGPLRVSIPLFNIFLNEADEWSRLLCTALAEWSHGPAQAPEETVVAAAHALAGSSATVGYRELSDLARSLEHALDRIGQRGGGLAAEMPVLLEGGEQIRYLLHQFAAGFLKEAPEGLREQLESLARGIPDPEQAAVTAPPVDEAPLDAPALPAALRELGAVRLTALADVDDAGTGADPAEAAHSGAAVPFAGFDDLSRVDVDDALDAELYPIFAEEADDLLPRLAEQLRRWRDAPQDRAPAVASLRVLHTLKGSARLAGAMRLGEMAHRLEGGVEAAVRDDPPSAERLEALQAGADSLVHEAHALRQQSTPSDEAGSVTEEPSTALSPIDGSALSDLDIAGIEPFAPQSVPPALPAAAADDHAATPHGDATQPAAIDWSVFADLPPAVVVREAAAASGASGMVRVRAGLLDRLVGHAGEVSIARARLEADLAQIGGAARDLNDNLDRLRRQLRDIELQGETQIASRMEAAKSASQQFDPLELDRFTRFQELTRMMAESVNDVATVQRSLQQGVQAAEDDLVAQARTTRALQDDLLRARMVEFDSLSERLYRVARQAARERGRQVRLDIEGAGIEMDRGVLERLAGCFEHLLRNAVAHGIEDADARVAAGKDPVGRITVSLAQEGNEVAIVFRDDGGGLDLPRIRARAEAMGLVPADEPLDDAALAAMIFRPGFSTAAAVTELAGRGIGMDVVRDEVAALGGRIETATTAGRGTAFRLVVPLTTAVTQVVVVRCGALRVALPAAVVELVRRVPSAEVARAYADGAMAHADGAAASGEETLPFFWLGALLQAGRPEQLVGKTQAVLWVRSAAQRVALHVDQVVGQQEVVVKHLGPQLARLPGLTGVSQLASGEVVLIYNPVALATVYGAQVQRLEAARSRPAHAAGPAGPPGAVPVAVVAEPAQAPLVLVVDDSLTVRRVTQRLLVREGYRVVLAKDGVDAIDRLADERPILLLTDIEMPRMDGFDLVRHVRADRTLAGLPIIMITSRIAGRHREHALELGVDHYLGKPFSEDELLSIVRQHAPLSVA